MKRSTKKKVVEKACPKASVKLYSFAVLIFSIVLVLLLTEYRLWQPSWLSQELQGTEDDPKIKQLYDDLESAVKPFLGDNFNLNQLLGNQPKWGTLNSGHYFGLKLSSPNSIETSLAWFTNEINHEGGLKIRHLCEQNDRLESYSWIRHNFHSFGQQIIHDKGYKIETSFVIDSTNVFDWEARIDVASTHLNQPPLSVLHYVTAVHPSDVLRLDYVNTGSFANNSLLFKISGFSQDIGHYNLKIYLTSGAENVILSASHSGHIDKNRIPVTTYLSSQMVSSIRGAHRLYHLDKGDQQLTNIIACQMITEGPISYRLIFSQGKSSRSSTDELYEAKLQREISVFDKKFTATFNVGESLEKLGKVALSNMIGSVGYFYGYSFIGSSLSLDKIAPYGPIQLLTGVPSRSFFPRGFLWDEAFHNLLISRWDSDLTKKIIKSWCDIMNINGWIPREVILGAESMRRVPREFIVQRVANANPPAMFLLIEDMLNRNLLDNQTILHIYPRLIKWYEWFETTQFGLKRSTYRWRGRDELSTTMLNPKTLTSGLDDYPRASNPSSQEYHVDLRCWMALVTRNLVKLASVVGDRDSEFRVAQVAHQLADNSLLDRLHWSDEHEMYCDFGIDHAFVELVRVKKSRPPSETNGPPSSYEIYERRTKGNAEFRCVPEFGYVSLFPLMMRILDPTNRRLGAILSRLRDKEQLWSDFGIRSLSKKSRYYMRYNTEHDKPYWRGAIWLNMNYLILSSLKYYSGIVGPYQRDFEITFAELKRNLVDNTYREFKRTNYLWENYNDVTGKGQGSHPFTGWTSLILLIMSSDL